MSKFNAEDCPAVKQLSAYVAASERELHELDYQYRKLFFNCAPVTRQEAIDFLAGKAKELGFSTRGECYAGLSHDELVREGLFLARHRFDKTEGACLHSPELTTWAMMNNDEITDVLRLMWVPRLVPKNV